MRPIVLSDFVFEDLKVQQFGDWSSTLQCNARPFEHSKCQGAYRTPETKTHTLPVKMFGLGQKVLSHLA